MTEEDYDESYDHAMDARQFSSFLLVGVLSLILTAVLN
jgi:hypothetical protein